MSWYYSTNREQWYGTFETREDAIAEGQVEYDAGEIFFVAECEKQDWNLSQTGDDILEALNGQNEDLDDEDGGFLWDSTTKEQRDDLGARVTQAIYDWAKVHSINLTAYCFASIENLERVKATGPSEP